MRTLKILGFGVLALVTSGALSGCYAPGYYGPRAGWGYRHHHHGWR